MCTMEYYMGYADCNTCCCGSCYCEFAEQLIDTLNNCIKNNCINLKK